MLEFSFIIEIFIYLLICTYFQPKFIYLKNLQHTNSNILFGIRSTDPTILSQSPLLVDMSLSINYMTNNWRIGHTLHIVLNWSYIDNHLEAVVPTDGEVGIHKFSVISPCLITAPSVTNLVKNELRKFINNFMQKSCAQYTLNNE